MLCVWVFALGGRKSPQMRVLETVSLAQLFRVQNMTRGSPADEATARLAWNAWGGQSLRMRDRETVSLKDLSFSRVFRWGGLCEHRENHNLGSVSRTPKHWVHSVRSTNSGRNSIFKFRPKTPVGPSTTYTVHAVKLMISTRSLVLLLA